MLKRVAAYALITAGLSIAAEHNTRHPYRESWKKSMAGRDALVGTAAGAAFSQATGHSKQYGQGLAGFGRRVGFGYATHAVGTTVEHLVAAPLHEDLQYHRSNQKEFGPRLRHALVSTVVTRNTQNGMRRPAVGKLSGNAAKGVFAQLLLPAGNGAATAGLGLAALAGANVAREFWPQKKQVKAR